ncbi:hypothetical protein EC991_007321 [Linnemannia zychae]|nr:hypothetical protein EC991_007321 [Linnemannia zychae]
MSLEVNDSEGLVQAVRTVNKNQSPSSTPPPTSDDILYLDCHVAPDTNKPFILWEDILEMFKGVEQVRHKARVLLFMKGPDFRAIEPRRIAAVPNAVLDIVLGGPVVSTDEAFTTVERQAPLSPNSLREEEEEEKEKEEKEKEDKEVEVKVQVEVEKEEEKKVLAGENNDWQEVDAVITIAAAQSPQLTGESIDWQEVGTVTSTTTARNPELISENIDWQEAGTATSTATARNPALIRENIDWQEIAIAISTTAARNPAYGLENAALENYTHINRPAAFPTSLTRGPHTNLVKDDPVSSSDAQPLRRAPQRLPRDLDQTILRANLGKSSAQLRLGFMYERGQGVPQDYQESMIWYLKAAEQGNPIAQCNIGSLYCFGLGVTRNYSKAMEWYLKGANQGLATAQHNLGTLYDQGHGIPQDYSKAMEWYLKAAEQGDDGAQWNIGVLYRYGQGVPKDHDKAMEWFRKAADQGNAMAKNYVENLEGETF